MTNKIVNPSTKISQKHSEMADQPVPVTGVHLFKVGSEVVVRIEVEGEWREVIREKADGAYSHIVETYAEVKPAKRSKTQ